MECQECGFYYVPGLSSDEAAHAEIHDEWVHGSHFPPDEADRVIGKVYGLDLVEAATSDSSSYRERFWKAALRARSQTDFPTPYDGGAEEGEWDGRAYVLHKSERALGFAVVRQRGGAWWWSWSAHDAGQRPQGPADTTVRRMVDYAWILPSLQRKGIGSDLIRVIARHLATPVADMGWTWEFTPAGERLVRRLTGEGFWVSL